MTKKVLGGQPARSFKSFIISQEAIDQPGLESRYSTPPIAEVLCVKNGRAIVVCGFLMKLLKKCILKV